MQRPMSVGTKHRLSAAGIGLLLGNFLVALLIDQLKINLQPSVIVTGTLLLVTAINILVSKYMK